MKVCPHCYRIVAQPCATKAQASECHLAKYRHPPDLRNRVAELLVILDDAENRAHKAGYHITAQALNRAKNTLGWEMAGEPDQATQAARRGLC